MRARIKVEDYDGNIIEAEGVFAGWGDQVAFERRFDVNAAILGRIGEAFNDDGSLKPDADAGAIKTEWVAFLAWRLLARGPAKGTQFDAWLENVNDLELNMLDDETDAGGSLSAVPTTATATRPHSG